MINPLFSIITVTRNNLGGLQKTYGSVLAQTCDAYEWIVIDGASTDNTHDFLKQNKAHWISEADNGIYDAMNKGIERANGKYLIFMNAGDCFADNETLALIKEQAELDPDFIYGDALEDRHIKKARPHTKINQGMVTHHQAMIYKAPLKQYDLTYTIAADYDLTMSVLKNVKNVTYIPKPLCIFETGGLSQQNVRKGRIEQFNIRRKHGIPPIENNIIFISQTLLYQLRRFFPSFYWFLKRH